MAVQDIINTSFIILQVFCLLLLPLIIWMVKSILNHGTQIILLKKEVDDSFPRKFVKIEESIDVIKRKMEKLTEDSIYTKSKIDNIESLLIDIKNNIHDMRG
jgi:hypothetical protein